VCSSDLYLRQQKARRLFESAELWSDGKLLARSDNGQPLVWRVPARSGACSFDARIAGPSDAQAYVGWLQTGVPAKPLPSADHGLRVMRRYLDKAGKPVALGRLQSGTLVTVELVLDAPGELKNVVIEDLLPAGLEIENPRLVTAADDATLSAASENDKRDEFALQHLDIRDDRLVLVGHVRDTGHCRYAYQARAVTPGVYVVPPVRAECMYDIAVNSLSGGGTMTVLAQRQ
jgi:uncharacterized protein YfaS (alpha-2-macroglobulin family)